MSQIAGGENQRGLYRLWTHCPGLSESVLTEYFSQFGNVLDVYIPRDVHDGSRKNYGFATFETLDGLQQTLAAGLEHTINGRRVRVNWAGPRPPPDFSQQAPGVPPGLPVQYAPQPPPVEEADRAAGSRGSGPRIYVGGIPTAVSETMVRVHFSQWGQVTDVYFPKDRTTSKRKNFCFVTFQSQQAAEKAAAQSNREISGYRIESITLTHDRQSHYQHKASGSWARASSEGPAPSPGPGRPFSTPANPSASWVGGSGPYLGPGSQLPGAGQQGLPEPHVLGAGGRELREEAFNGAYSSREAGQQWPYSGLPGHAGPGAAAQARGFYSYTPDDLLYLREAAGPYGGLPGTQQLPQQQQQLFMQQQLEGLPGGMGPYLLDPADREGPGGLQQAQLLGLVQPRALQRPGGPSTYQQLTQVQEQLGRRPPVLLPLAAEELRRGRPWGEGQ